MTKLTIICGPTAVGKTDFALSIAKKIGADLISIDSRQVYQGMNIGTGKDIPENAVFTCKTTFSVGNDIYRIGYYTIQSTRLWLCDIAKPNQPFSSAIFKRAFDLTLELLAKDTKSAILIGGTGYYLKSVLYPPATIAIPPNQELRSQLAELSVTQLQEQLCDRNLQRFSIMNQSDRANPHRLIRAIEITHSQSMIIPQSPSYEVGWFGLTAPKETLSQRITMRVKKRIDHGFSNELHTLIQTYPNFFTLQAGKALGFREWGNYLSNTWSQEEAIKAWISGEIAYAGRQITWFNKQTGLIWFDITDENWYAEASEALERWINHGTYYT